MGLYAFNYNDNLELKLQTASKQQLEISNEQLVINVSFGLISIDSESSLTMTKLKKTDRSLKFLALSVLIIFIQQKYYNLNL